MTFALRVVAMVALAGLGCRTPPAAPTASSLAPSDQRPATADKTEACWAGLVESWMDWDKYRQQVRSARPLQQFESVKNSEKERWFDAALAHSRSMGGSIVVLQTDLESLPIQGVAPELTDHILEWQALLPLWQEKYESEQAFLIEWKAVYPKTTTLGSIVFVAPKLFGAFGELFWDKVNAPTTKSNAFEDGKARIAREFEPVERSKNRMNAASDKFRTKLDEVLAKNRDLRVRLSRSLGVDLPVLPTFVIPNHK